MASFEKVSRSNPVAPNGWLRTEKLLQSTISVMEDQKMAARLVATMSNSLKGRPVQVYLP